jgi:hypothetical protein
MSASIPSRFADCEKALHEAATSITGLSDFGPERYLEGLRVLLNAMDDSPRFSEDGRQFAFRELVLALIARLHTEQGWKDRPGCLATEIRRPLIITGLPRSCTTTLQRLLSVDPQFQGLDSWLAQAPMVRPPREQWASMPEYHRCVDRLNAWFEAVPQFRARHDMAADDVDECIEVLRQDFITNRFGCNFDVPRYDEWWLAQDEGPSYRRYADVLRLIGADEPDQRWLLKNPGHIYQIDALLEVFPDACIIYTHRDPLQAIPSVASVIWTAHQVAEGAAARPEVCGPREIAVWSRGTAPMMRARERRPDQFHDVQHRDFVADPLAVVHGVYERFGLALTPEVEDEMRAWVRDNPLGKRGEHRYTLAEYGLSEEAVRESFQDYIDAYAPF